MATKDIICMDCGKLLARVIKINKLRNYESTSLCYSCAVNRWEAHKGGIKTTK